jgi:hypothetical protein
MRPPFGREELFMIFSEYNASVWPMQLILLTLALVAVMLTRPGSSGPSRAVSWILTVLWLWSGAAYHFAHFSSINSAAWVFGALFLLQAALFAVYGGVREKLRFMPTDGAAGVTGFLLILYSLFIYPVAGYLAGHGISDSPTFGTPCPVTIFTLGMLFLLERPFPRALPVIPILWSVLGGSAALFLGVPQDFGLIVAGAAAVVLLIAAAKPVRMSAEKDLKQGE